MGKGHEKSQPGGPSPRLHCPIQAGPTHVGERGRDLDVIIEKALAGDSNSASLILSRVTPSLKAVARPVEFDFDPEAPVSRQVEMVIAAIADGSVPADIGRQVIDAISNLGSMRMQEDLEARIAVLEAASGARA